ncbi:MAG: hypothetical protein U0132_18605 [Gemmatimonadaceae bacterium]
MMAPQVYEDARANAPIHIQIWKWRGTDRTPRGGSALLIARVVRIFRDRDHALRLGRRVSVRVPIIHDTGSSGPMLSGTINHDWDRLSQANWFEAFMESDGDHFELTLSQIAAIRGPTLRPICGPDQKGFLCEGNFP